LSYQWALQQQATDCGYVIPDVAFDVSVERKWEMLERRKHIERSDLKNKIRNVNSLVENLRC
jgi:hypothetical protein